MAGSVEGMTSPNRNRRLVTPCGNPCGFAGRLVIHAAAVSTASMSPGGGGNPAVSEPNEALAQLIEEADQLDGCSLAGLARRVNTLGYDEGLTLRYDYTAVHRWVKKGERPRPPVPSLLARALSEKLGRRITPADFGMTDAESLASRGLRYPASPLTTVDTLYELGKADVKRRSVIKAPFALAALAAPSRDWLLAILDETANERGPRKVGLKQVEGIREMFRLFQEMDVMRGGGHGRVALVEYMNSYVLPLLRRKHDPAVEPLLYQAASEQAYLVGWMAYDDGQHGLAQRYLIQSLRLAQASGDAKLGAHVLAGMSDQANLLGHPHEALKLAKSGQRGITLHDSPACLADLYILEARAHAALHDERATAKAVRRAEDTFGHVAPADEPEWARFIDAAYLFGEAAHCFRDLGQPDQIDRFAGESAAEAKRQGRARRGTLSQAALSIAHLERGEVDQAAATGLQVIQLATTVDSSRCLETIRDLRRRLNAYTDVPAVQEFNHKAAQAFGTAA
jgi:hypothetical protein